MIVLSIDLAKDRRRIKLNLLGLCGKKSEKSIREIAFALAPRDYSGSVNELLEEARKIAESGRLYYRGDKFLFFKRINDSEPVERYEITLDRMDSGWGSH